MVNQANLEEKHVESIEDDPKQTKEQNQQESSEESGRSLIVFQLLIRLQHLCLVGSNHPLFGHLSFFICYVAPKQDAEDLATNESLLDSIISDDTDAANIVNEANLQKESDQAHSFVAEDELNQKNSSEEKG